MATPTQLKIYDYIKTYIAENNHSPSLMEIAHGIGIRSKSLISRYVHALQKQGLIDLDPKGYRQIRLKIPSGSIPLMGRIAAGSPIEALPQNETINLHELVTNQERTSVFALEVKGDSMIDEGIFNGDLVLCESRNSAHEGEIVVALIDNQEATLKRISYQIKNNIILTPENPNLLPKMYEAHRVSVQGIFIGLIRMNKRSRV